MLAGLVAIAVLRAADGNVFRAGCSFILMLWHLALDGLCNVAKAALVPGITFLANAVPPQ